MQVAGIAGEDVQGIGVEHHGRARVRQEALDDRCNPLAHPQAGPDDDRIGRFVEDPRQGAGREPPVRVFVERDGHQLGRKPRDLRLRAAWRGDGDQPGPTPQRSHASEIGGAGLADGARDHEHTPEVALVRLGLARFVDDEPDVVAREEVDARTVDPIDHVLRDADLGDDQVAAVALGRRQDQRQLRRPERHRDRRLHHVARDRRGVRRQPRRQIHGHDRQAAGVDVVDDALQETAGGAPESGAEYRVDNEVVRLELAEVQLPVGLIAEFHDREPEPAQDVEVRPGIALHLGRPPEQEHRDVDAAQEQRPRDHEPVAAVVAAPRQDRDAA